MINVTSIVNTSGVDVHLTDNSGTTWCFFKTITITAVDDRGSTLARRFCSLLLDVSGVNALRLLEHGT